MEGERIAWFWDSLKGVLDEWEGLGKLNIRFGFTAEHDGIEKGSSDMEGMLKSNAGGACV